MNKLSVVLLCIIFVLVGGICGFFISNHMNSNQDSKNEIVGTYKTSTWNGKEAVLILNKDKTCIHPSGTAGTWSAEDNKLYVEVVFDYSSMMGDFGVEKEKPKPSIIEGMIVEEGIYFNGHFFEKLD